MTKGKIGQDLYQFASTPLWASQILADELKKKLPGGFGSYAYFFEPCVGDRAIPRAFPSGLEWRTNDLNPEREADTHYDMTKAYSWAKLGSLTDAAIITNPPYGALAPVIVEHACRAKPRLFAAFLRCTWFEPCDNRVHVFQNHPFKFFISLPRISFLGDGGTDKTSCVWFVWGQDLPFSAPVFYSKDDVKAFKNCQIRQ